ncbi:MAG: histidine triad (HIT) protein [Magnetococcales bacterium]|nr:histidine triad (HIT) protein [Magnetococcales bacterium]HIJ82959.1 HIT domain-containing protein [Magnetococcales bacterium]
MNQTELHPTLAKDGIMVGSLSACMVLLMNDRHYPWLVLVPDRPGLRDFDDLTETDVPLVFADIKRTSQLLRTMFRPTKINVAALGNVVAQLHIHIIARFESDKAWPKPVWGIHPPQPYPDEILGNLLPRIRKAFDMPDKP